MQWIDEENIKGNKGPLKKTLDIRSKYIPTMRITRYVIKKDEGKRITWYNSNVSLGGTKHSRTCTLLENKEKKREQVILRGDIEIQHV